MKSAVSLLAVIFLLVIVIIAPAIAADDAGISVQPTNTTSQPAGNVTSTVTPSTAAADANAAEKTDTTEETKLTKEVAIFWAFLGIFFSFAIPVLKTYAVKIVKRLRKTPDAEVNTWQEVWKAASPYLATTLLALFVAVVVVASLYSAKTPMPDWYVPFLAGYAWDSTLQKLNPDTPPAGVGP